jgi:hypothetical protein
MIKTIFPQDKLNPFLKISLALFVACYLHLFQGFAQQKSTGSVFFAGGVNISKLYSDSLNLKSNIHPCAAIGYNQPLYQNLSLNLDLHYTIAGAGNATRFRNHYIGVSLFPQYQFGNVFRLYGGACCDRIMVQKVGLIEGTAGNGIKWDHGTGFSQQFALIFGIAMNLNRKVWIHGRQEAPVSHREFSGTQFFLSISAKDLEFRSRGKKFYSLEDALAHVEECRRLVLQNEHLSSLSPEIGKLVNLEELILDYNNLQTLPVEIGNLVKLRYLSIKYNELESLPASIGNLQNLQHLNLDHNQLRHLPTEIGQLQSLKLLYIGKNSLEDLPYSIGDLTLLTELDVHGSGPMLHIPESVGKLRYLDLLIVDSSELPLTFIWPNNRMRVVVRD